MKAKVWRNQLSWIVWDKLNGKRHLVASYVDRADAEEAMIREKAQDKELSLCLMLAHGKNNVRFVDN